MRAAALLCAAAVAMSGEAGLPEAATASVAGEVIHANTLEIAGLTFRDVTALPAYREGRLEFRDIDAKAYRGRITGTYSIGLIGDRRTHRCSFEFSGIELGLLARSLGAVNEQLAGRVDGWVTFELPVGDPSGMVGRGEVRVSDGSLVQLPLMVSFLAGNPAASRGKDQLTARFELRGGSVHLVWVLVESPAVRLLAQGKISFDGRLEIEISPRLPFAVIDRVPLIGSGIASALSKFTGTVTRAYVRGHVSQPVIVVNALGR